MEGVAASVRRSIVGLGTGRDASLAPDADGRIVQESHGCVGHSHVLVGLQHIRADRDCNRGRDTRFGDSADQLSASDGHVSPLSDLPVYRERLSAFQNAHGRWRFG